VRDLKLWEAEVGSAEYLDLLALRFEELRKPLGMSWTAGELEADKGDRHFGLREKGDWLGTVVVSGQGAGAAKLRQIAVTGERQGEGLGRILMERIEEKLALEGVVEFVLNARLTVAEFYEAVGYLREGDLFEEIGLPHLRMRKRLKRGSA